MTFHLTPGRARWVCLAALVLTALFGWLNLHVPSAGIVQNALLDKNNRYLQWEQQAATHPDVQKGDTLSFVLNFPGGVDAAGLAQVVRMTEEVKALYPEAAVWSLAANSYDYRVRPGQGGQGGQIESQAYLSAAQLDRQGALPASFALAPWKDAVRGDATVFGTLVGREFDYAQIFVFLPEDYSEQGIVDRTAEYLEQRPISDVEWLLWKGDIRPAAKYANVSLGGWSVARGLMHYALISNVLFYATVGLLIATLAAVFSLGSRRQAVQVTTVIFVSFVLVRGCIPLMAGLGLRFYGEPVYERVYFLLVLSALIVAGISFNVRAFEAFNDAWRANPQREPARIWQALQPLRAKLNVVAAIAVLNFATLPQIGIRGILEVGVLSALGILIQRVLVVTLLPALHLCVGGLPDDVQTSRLAGLVRRYTALVNWFPQRAFALLGRLTPRQSLRLSLAITASAVLLALGIAGHDLVSTHKWIVVQERPIDYLPHTIVDRGREILNREGGAGFSRLSFLVLPAPGNAAGTAGAATDDPRFIADTWALQQRMAQVAGAKSVRSILDKLSQVAERSPDVGTPLPTTRQQAHELLQMIRWDFDNPKLADDFWTANGYVLFAAHDADNSRALREYADGVMHIAHTEFPQLQVLPFGRLHTYHQTDEYISQGKPLNVLTSFPLVVAVCALWLWLANRRLARQSQHPTLHPLRTALAVSLPFVFAYALIVVVMAVFGIPLDQATACATALGINAAIDFDIYVADDFMQALQRGDSVDAALAFALCERGRVTVVDAKLNAICFSFLMLSPFLPIQRLGVVMLLMLLACAFGALVLMTGVLRSCVVVPAGQRVPAPHPAAGHDAAPHTPATPRPQMNRTGN